MSYLDEYKKRLTANGTTQGESFANSTKDIINKTFADSPFYKILKINNADIETRVLTTKLSHVKNLLFRSEVIVNKGSYVELEDETWLVTDSINDGIYSKSVIQKCNDVLKWKVGTNTFEYKCVATATVSPYPFNMNERVMVTLPNGEINVFVQLNAGTSTITEKQRFIIGKRPYHVTGIDNISEVIDGIGFLKILMKLDIELSTDDKSGNIADNTKTKTGGGRDWLTSN